MDINKSDIQIIVADGQRAFVSVKWYRGASRYNNGATKYGRKYQCRVIMGWASARKIKYAGQLV